MRFFKLSKLLASFHIVIEYKVRMQLDLENADDVIESGESSGTAAFVVILL